MCRGRFKKQYIAVTFKSDTAVHIQNVGCNCLPPTPTNCCEKWCNCFLTEGLQEVILYHQPDDKKKNRGFCFLEYEDHKSAAQARRRLMSGKVKVWGNPVTVEWADPVAEPDPEVMAKVSKP